MTSFLFWNVGKNDLRSLIGRAAVERKLDIILLAESEVPDEEMAGALAKATGDNFVAITESKDRVRIYTRLERDQWVRKYDDPSARMALWSVRVGKHPGIILATAHLMSKNKLLDVDQALLTSPLAKEICRAEETVGHERTVVVGDLNMNPFEPGISAAQTLHAVMTKKLAGQKTRDVQGARIATSTIPCGASSAIERMARRAPFIIVTRDPWNCSGICSIRFWSDPI